MDQEKLLKPIGIERLVDWAFGQQKVALMDGRDRGIFPVLALLSKTTVNYGERIGGGGASGAGYDVHPDAAIVLDAWREVMTYSADGACLVRSYGESGFSPDWVADGELRFIPEIDPQTGMPKQARDHNRHLVRESCRVKRVGKSPDVVRVARAEYRVWWHALHLMQDFVADYSARQGGLVTWRLTSEMPPKEPWLLDGAANGLFFEKAS
ncbi:hypothetical protein [Thalassospira lucentensis]|uniref:hypothetical protein n=1 Tax=Thalassospira lucentensis TaxID=168935 RepID=UPI003D2ADCA8